MSTYNNKHVSSIVVTMKQKRTTFLQAKHNVCRGLFRCLVHTYHTVKPKFKFKIHRFKGVRDIEAESVGMSSYTAT